ncbi:MAG: YbaB/EbfC family nucleoid-associated protein [Chloracidobacterium sp.]|nr:YbaB/EbfC family nucleoid-associated protein [Chloracidobacterium sp.]MDW8217448.1 YbaB/EbfC family nucleoid-associated protein [Acidobacteriota bacterium]
MKLPGLDRLPGFERAMEQMRQKQEEIKRALESARCEGSAGGGMVRITVNGLKQVISVKLDAEALADKEMLEALIAAAFNEAVRRADEVTEQHMQQQMSSLLGNLKIPGTS